MLAAGSPQSAVTFAQAQASHASQDWFNRCLQFVNDAWGHSVSWLGTSTAMQSWLAAPNKITDGSVPPVGAAVYWATSNPAGHVALSVGNGYVATTDFCKQGSVCIVPIDQVTKGWNANLLGWSSPNGAHGSPTSGATDNLGLNPLGPLGKIGDGMHSIFSGSFLPRNFGIRFLWFLLGLFLVIVGMVILFRRPIQQGVEFAANASE